MIVYFVQQTEDYHGAHVYAAHATLAGAQAAARLLAVGRDYLGDEDAAAADWHQADKVCWNLATARYREGRDLTWQVRAVTLQD